VEKPTDHPACLKIDRFYDRGKMFGTIGVAHSLHSPDSRIELAALVNHADSSIGVALS
jgi:hypothetical protein